MRICRLSRLHPREEAPGSGLMPYNLSKYLPGPSLYITKSFNSPPATFPDHVHVIFIPYPEPSFPDRLEVGILRSFFIYIGKALGNILFTVKALPSLIHFRPDIIHTHSLHLILPALIGAQLMRCPLVLTFHGTEYYRFRSNSFLKAIVRHFVDFVMCIAPDMHADFQQLMPDKPAAFIANGVDLSQFIPDPSRGKQKQIVFVGRLVWQKGLDNLLEAVASVFRTIPDYQLILVGDGPLRIDLEAQAHELGINNRVIFTGTLSQSEVIRILQTCEVFVLSSVSEGFPKALIEAMACGLPVVATNVGACSDVARNAGLVVKSQNPEELSEALQLILNDNDLRQQYAENAFHDATRYSWESCSKSVMKIYEELTLRTECAKIL